MAESPGPYEIERTGRKAHEPQPKPKENPMTKLTNARRAVAATTAAAALVLLAGTATAAVVNGDYVGKSKAEIAQNLEQQGYEVRKVETEDGNLEAYAILDRKRVEIYVDPQTGNVVKIKQAN